MGWCRAHIEHEFNKLRSSNSVSVRVKSVGDWWEADPESKLFCLAERALAREWNVQPLLVREGGTMPVTLPVLVHLQAYCTTCINVSIAEMPPNTFQELQACASQQLAPAFACLCPDATTCR